MKKSESSYANEFESEEMFGTGFKSNTNTASSLANLEPKEVHILVQATPKKVKKPTKEKEVGLEMF